MKTAIRILKSMLIFLLIFCVSAWVSLFIYTHLVLGDVVSYGLIGIWLAVTIFCLIGLFKPNWLPKQVTPKITKFTFATGFILAVAVFFSLTPSNSRNWKPEVSQMLDYDLAKDGKIITLYNVRNFDWKSETDYQERWETRQYDLANLQSVDLVASYWMGDKIAHTLLSFGFSDGKRVAFSIEIRKEIDEDFTTWGGFFRNYEIIIIASDEKDVIYTRSNARHEDVYIYPLTLSKDELKPLFLAYVNRARALKSQPTWYNSLTYNCTTAMRPLFNSMNPITPLSLDYRWVVSGYFPDYLYDENKISHQYDFATWQQKAYINPKSDKFFHDNPISSADYSALIRQDF